MTPGIELLNRRGDVVGLALVDEEDFARFGHLRWYMSSDGYARRTAGRKVYLHRAIMNRTEGDGLLVDHINRDRLDNRRSNLRVVTKAQQQQNLSPRKNCTSQYRGVFMRKQSGRWVAQGKGPNGKRITLGTFDSEEEAGRVAADHRRKVMPHSTETLEPIKARPAYVSSRPSASPYIGVGWSKAARKWLAYVSIDGRRKHLGYFTDEIEAARVAADARGLPRP